MTTVAPHTPPTNPVPDLARRWGAARRAALRTLAPDAPPEADELELLRLAPNPEEAARRVFDNSRLVGQGFRRFYGVDLTLNDLAELLPALGLPCHAGGFAKLDGDTARRAVRSPCADGRSTPGCCAVWAEATLGLVGGLSTAVYLTRQQSPATGGDLCADLLHLDAQTPLRFEPVPESMQPALAEVTRSARRVDPGAKLEFLGLLDGALHFTLQAGADRGCGGLSVHAAVSHALSRRLPDHRFVDATPRPVLSTP